MVLVCDEGLTMTRILYYAMGLLSLTGCVTINGGSRPMGSIVGKKAPAKIDKAERTEEMNAPSESSLTARDRTVVQELVAAVPGRH